MTKSPSHKAAPATQPHTKVCKDCGKNRKITNFYSAPRSNGKVYYASYCKACAVIRSRAGDLRNKVGNYHKLWTHFKNNHCVDCDEANPLKLSLDHRDEKNDNISMMMKKKWHHIAKELKLCDVRCHNCHAVKTHASLGHYATESLRDYVSKWPENEKAYKEYAK